MWSNSVVLTCVYFFLHSETIVENFQGNNKIYLPQNVFCPNFLPHWEIVTIFCFCVAVCSFLDLYQVSSWSSMSIKKIFNCFLRIPIGTQKNFLVLSSREHGKASGGPSFPWLLLGKKMIVLDFHFNAYITNLVSRAFPFTFLAPPLPHQLRIKTMGTRLAHNLLVSNCVAFLGQTLCFNHMFILHLAN